MKKIKYLLPVFALAFFCTGCDTPDFPSENAVEPGTVNGMFVGNAVSATIDGTTVAVEPAETSIPAAFMRGFDASAVNDAGAGDYYDATGAKKDVFAVLKQFGVNYVRLRVWNNPASAKNPETPGASNKEAVVDQAIRAKAAGLKILLDFHYSDFWADPGKQLIPEAWLGAADSDEMAEKLSSYTKEVLNELGINNALPDMIQIGNEINSGILVHTSLEKSSTGDYRGKNTAVEGISGSSSSENFTKYLAAGINAAREAAPNAKIMLHVAGTNTGLFEKFKNANLDYDVIGLSWYPSESSHKAISVLGSTIANLKSTYRKEVVVAETNMHWNSTSALATEKTNLTVNGELYSGILSDSEGNIELSVQNQANVLRAVIEVAAKNGGIGTFVWGGEYKGAWNSMFAGSGKPLASMAVFGIQGE